MSESSTSIDNRIKINCYIKLQTNIEKLLQLHCYTMKLRLINSQVLAYTSYCSASMFLNIIRR
jgi:hypothetical protein